MEIGYIRKSLSVQVSYSKQILQVGKRKIDRFKVLEGRKALGAKPSNDGLESENMKWFSFKVAIWVDEVRTSYLNQSLI